MESLIEPKTEIVQLESRLGRVGSIQAWDPWESRKSVKHAKWWVSKIARLSHGLGEAEDFEAHFDRVVNQMHHESVLEFVPMCYEDDYGWAVSALPDQSLRRRPRKIDLPEYWGNGYRLAQELDEIRRDPGARASAFLVESPIFVARQWMRHRSSACLEMSRRCVKGSRVAWEYYGHEMRDLQCPIPSDFGRNSDGTLYTSTFWFICEAEYQRRLDAGWPNEIARGCMPVEAMTTFWVAGFDRDWEAFLKLRDDDRAQPETRVFATWIRTYLEGK